MARTNPLVFGGCENSSDEGENSTDESKSSTDESENFSDDGENSTDESENSTDDSENSEYGNSESDGMHALSAGSTPTGSPVASPEMRIETMGSDGHKNREDEDLFRTQIVNSRR